MRHELLNKLWLRVGIIVAVMTTALAGTVMAETVTYTVSSKTAVTTSGTAPAGSSVSFSSTANTAEQLTSGTYQVLTLSGYSGCTITGLTLNMKSNTSKGAGALFYSTDGGSTYTYLVGSGKSDGTDVTGVSFNNTSWYGAWSTSFVDITKSVTINASSSDIIIKIRATANSLYCHSYTLTYTPASGDTPPTPTSYTVTFDAGDGTFVGSTDFPNASNTKTAGTYTLPSATRDGYTFNGWVTTGSTTPVTGDYTVSENVAFTAQYTENVSPTGDLVIDFEGDASAYTDWTFVNMESNQTGSITAHGGTYYGTTGGKATASVTTKAKVATPNALTCYVSKQSTNTTSSTWYIQVSEDGSTWTDVTTRSATDMNKGEWKEFSADLSSYSNVYVRVYYSGSTAVRNIDDLTLTTSAKPIIAADNVSIAYNVTSGAIAYTISNEPNPAGTLTIANTADWLTFGTIGTTVPFTCSANEFATERTATVTLTYTYGDEQTVTKEVTITQAGNPNGYGSVNNPYTVAQARAAIDANTGTQGVYATGIVSAIPTAWSSQYNNITFNFVDTEGDTNFLQAYRCVSTDAADASTVAVGDIVVVKGNLIKYNGTYEFGQGCTLVSLEHPVVPTIIVSPASLSEFTYEEGNGPSDAKTFTISGENLTTDIELSLNGDYEMSLTEDGTYSSSLTLTQTSGAVERTTVYVRLKAGLDADDYEGTITLTSTDATTQTVSLSGSVTEPEAPHVTWDLSVDETATATTTEMTWTSNYATMGVAKGSATTNTNNYYPGTSGQTYTSTRFYKNSELTITPTIGYAITSVVFEATTHGYASALKSSSWTNATAAMEDGDNVKTVTVTPAIGIEAISATIGATCGFTSVKVYYEEDNTPIITANNVEIEYDATSGSISYTIENAPDPAGTLTASVPDGSWITLGTVTSTSIPFTCNVNHTTDSPEETVTLTYTYGDNETVTKNVIVTQRMPPPPTSPVIEVAENPFLFSTTATITCTEENVENIQYSFNGENWQDYNGPITITSSLILYAKAIRWGHISEVTSYEIIKSLAETSVTINGELNVDLNGGTNVSAGTLTAAVTYNNAAVQGATVTWSSSNTDIATINETTGAITLLTTGEVTFTATYAGNDDYAGATGTKTITVVDSSAPSIAVAPDEVSVDADEHEGTLALTYENLTITAMDDFGVQFYDADNNELNEVPDWIEVSIAEQDPAVGEGYVVKYFMLENEGAARSVYFKVFAMGNEDFVYSNLVTVTQAATASATTTYTLATNIIPGKRYIIVGKDGDYYKAMGQQNNNNRGTNSVTVNGQTATPQQSSNIYEFVIYGPDASENYTIYDVKSQGYLYAASSSNNYLRTQNTNDLNGKWNISIASDGAATIVAQGSNSRNEMRYNKTSAVFSCYGSGQQPVYLYGKDNDTAVATTATVTLNSSGYATFASTSVLDFLDAEDASYSAWQIKSVSGSTIEFEQITSTIATGTGILLKGTPSDDIALNILPVGGANLTSNKLEGFTAATVINSGEYYGLSGDKFVKVNGGTVPAGKALLPAGVVDGTSGVNAFTFNFDEDATAIKTIDNGQLTTDGVIYNVAGQRLGKMQKGINIVNGKKILK